MFNASFGEELIEILKTAGAQDALKAIAKNVHHSAEPLDLAGLGILGGIGADRLQAHLRAGKDATEHSIEKKQLLGESGHAVADTAGLGLMALPILAKRLHSGKW